MKFFNSEKVERRGGLLVAVSRRGGKAILSSRLAAVDRGMDGLMAAAIKNGFEAEAGEVLSVCAPQTGYSSVALVGMGEGDSKNNGAGVRRLFLRGVRDAVGKVKKAESLSLCLHDAGEWAAAAVGAVAAGGHRYRLGAEWPAATGIKKVCVVGGKVAPKTLARLAAAGEGARLAMHLAEQPGNVCTPSFLEKTARRMARGASSLQTTVFGESKMRTLKMGGLLAVSQGSAEEAKMIVVRHRTAAAKAGRPIVIVGKGVTFDTGGISLKPAAAMEEMKFDMCGAAAALGAVWAAAKMRLPIEVIAVVPSCENMPGGRAVKPGDVITMFNGKTVEVQNTDAEGRLILADALAYAAKFRPAAVIDAATLTGACVIALGHHLTGMFSRCGRLGAELQAAGEASGDECWALPFGEDYGRQLKSPYADLANIGGRPGGAITAAAFLSHFSDCPAWAHLDIAGTAWTPGKRATGRPVLMLAEFLARRAWG